MSMTDYTIVSISLYSRKTSKYDDEDIDSASGSLQLPPLLPPANERDQKDYYYGVRIITGAQGEAGTVDPGVYLRLTGTKAGSSKIYLTGGWLSWLSGGGCELISRGFDDLVIRCEESLGEIQVVELGNEKGWSSAVSNAVGAHWYVDFVMIHNFQSEQIKEFPCYHWIGDGEFVTFTSETATLHDIKGNDILSQQRKKQIEIRRKQYQWHVKTDEEIKLGLPGNIAANKNMFALPPDEQWEKTKLADFTVDGITSASALGPGVIAGSINDLSFYEDLVRKIKDPVVKNYLFEGGRWTSDVEFGRQILNGVNPVIVRKCDTLPSNFPVTNEMVRGFLCRGLSLQQEMNVGRVYIIDLKIMHGLKCKEGQYSCAPICLLYVNMCGQLVPIAIQLQQQPGEDNPIFLPSDNWFDWLVAKMYFNSAFGQLHQMSSHYLCCHSAMEAYGIATMRNIPDAHPVLKLLRPAFRYTMAINCNARLTLINPGGMIDQVWSIGGEGRLELVKRACGAYRVQHTNIKCSMEDRGVGDASALPNYYYRDDGLKLWEAMESYVQDVLGMFYKSDAEVKGDSEIQEWAADVHTNGFPAYSHETRGDHCSSLSNVFFAPEGRGFPRSIESLKDLVQYCTLIMFTGSVQHSAVNFGQFENLSFIPCSPLSLYKPPPTKKGELSFQDMIDCLPSKYESFLHVATTSTLSQHSPDEIYLIQYTRERFTEQNIKDKVTKFLWKLEEISTTIRERNKPLDIKYEWLLPENIPQSITI